LAGRHGHYAGVDLLPSQLATLERGDDVVAVPADALPDQVAARVLAAVGSGRSR
jgi:gluconate kinase